MLCKQANVATGLKICGFRTNCLVAILQTSDANPPHKVRSSAEWGWVGSNWLSGYPLGGFTSNREKHESIVWFQSSSYQSKHYVLLKKGGLTSCSCAVDAPSAWCMVRFNALKRWVMRAYHSHRGVPSLLQHRLKPVLLMWRITWAHVVNHISGLNHIISKWHTSPQKCFNQFLSEWPYICYIFGKVLVQLAKNITNQASSSSPSLTEGQSDFHYNFDIKSM